MSSPSGASVRPNGRRSKRSIRRSAWSMPAAGFDGEYRETWPAEAVARFVPDSATGAGTRAERDRLLAEAEVILAGFPFPRDLRARAPRLRWVHQRPAGASNLRAGDLWGRDVVVTTSRGDANAPADRGVCAGRDPTFRQGAERAAVDREAGAFDHARLSAGAARGQDGLRRRRRRHRARGRSAMRRARHAGDRHAAPGAVGCIFAAGLQSTRQRWRSRRSAAGQRFRGDLRQWTPETTNLFDRARFAAMKPGSVIVNIARWRGHRRGGAGRRAGAHPSARRRARRLCRRGRAHADAGLVARPAGPDHAAHVMGQRPGAARGRGISATICAPISTARRSATSSIGNADIDRITI